MAAALALLASLSYGVSNYVGPRLARESPMLVLLLVGQACSFALAGVIVVAAGEGAPPSGELGWAVLAGLGNAGGLILFYRAAAIGPLSVVVPIGSLGAVLPVVAGVATGEPLDAAKAGGILFALGGVVLVARRGSDGGAHPPGVIALAGASAVAFGIFLAAMAPASEASAGWAVMVSRFGLLAVLLAFATHEGVLRAGARPPRGRLPLLAVPGLLLFVGTMAYALATREGDVSTVAVLGSLFPAVTVTLAVVFDDERLSRHQLLGMVALTLGIALLSSTA